MEKFRPPQPIPAKIFHTVEKSFPHRGKLPPRPSRHPLTSDLCPLTSFPGCSLNPEPRTLPPFPGCSLNPEPSTLNSDL